MARGNFGERLKRERELREVSQKELTTATRIGPRFLDALENEEWEKLPGGVFNRGFVRAIARYLGLDEENLLAEYDLARGDANLPVPQPYENKIPRPPIWIPIALLFAALAILVGIIAGGIYGWRHFAAWRASRKPSASTALSTPVSAVTTATSPDSSSNRQAVSAGSPDAVPLDLSVATSAATHVRILGDGALLLDEELAAGETRHFPAKQQFEVTVGDSSAVLLELNGKAMPPISTPGASGTIVLSQKDLRQAPSGSAQP